MGRLRAALRDTYAAKGQEINIHTPKNCEPLTLTFRQERMVKVSFSFEQLFPLSDKYLTQPTPSRLSDL